MRINDQPEATMTEPNIVPIAEAIRQMLADQFPASVTLQYPLPRSPAPMRAEIQKPEPERLNHKPISRPTHSPDWSSVCWPARGGSVVYTFTPKQRPIVAMLWEAMDRGTHFVGSAALLEAAEVECGKMSDLFRDSSAWKTLIVMGLICGGPAGTYRFAPIDNETSFEKGGAA